MDGGFSNLNQLPFLPDFDLDAALTELDNYVSSTGGPPLFASAPPVAHHHILQDLPPVQNVPNIPHPHLGDVQAFSAGPQNFGGYPGHGIESGQRQSQPSEALGRNPLLPPATPAGSGPGSAPNIGTKARKTSADATKGTPKPKNTAASRRGQTGAGNAQSAPATTPKASGKGSKAGAANRRDPGASDEEIEALSVDAKENAGLPKVNGLTEEEKYTVVEYITDEHRWASLKVKQTNYFDELVKIFNKRVKPNQISNFWHNQAWAKYKACRENLVKHTGGGDPDDPNLMSESEAEPDVPDLAGGVAATRPGRIFFKRKIDGEFSLSVLRKFLNSNLYAMIHKRAHSDNSVERKRARDSASVISDDELTLSATRKRKRGGSEEDSDADSALQDALTFMKKRARTEAETAQAQLEIARRRDKREQLEFEARQELQTREMRLREQQTYLQMVNSGVPELVEAGTQGILKLTKEDGKAV